MDEDSGEGAAPFGSHGRTPAPQESRGILRSLRVGCRASGFSVIFIILSISLFSLCEKGKKMRVKEKKQNEIER